MKMSESLQASLKTQLKDNLEFYENEWIAPGILKNNLSGYIPARDPINEIPGLELNSIEQSRSIWEHEVSGNCKAKIKLSVETSGRQLCRLLGAL